MEEWYGWAGTILRVNLNNGTVSKKPLTEELAFNFLGGRGFNIKVLWDEIKPGIDPLSPENVLCIGVGPLNGTLFPCTGRFNISYKSPETAILGDGNAGGSFAARLKHAGYDQIVVTGRADRPVYLWIDDEEVEIKDASHLWGKTTWEAEDAIRKDDGAMSVCSIGPAGENLVRTACVITDWYNAQGMCGGGAVFGSKNLKAIGVRGTIGVKIAKTDEFEELSKKAIEKRTKEGGGWKEYAPMALRGTPHITELSYESGTFDFDMIRYYTTTVLPFYDNFTSDNVLKHTVRLKSCWACPVHCKRMYEVREIPNIGLRGGGIEYNCLIFNAIMNDLHDWGELCYLNNLYNQLGITVSHGHTIAYLIYLYKKGLITKKQTDGIELNWGDAELVAELLRKTARRDGFLGNLLAEGQFNAGRILGPEALRHCIHVLGLNATTQFRGRFSVWIHRCTSTRGADHLRGDTLEEINYWAQALGDPKIAEKSPYGKHIAATYGQNVCALMDSYEVCKFSNALWGEEASNVLFALTGRRFTAKMLWEIGERIYNLEQAFNVREGVKRKHIVPPQRFFEEPQPDGHNKGYVCTWRDHNEMMDDYLKLRGWDKDTAVPGREKLEELGLKYVALELEEGKPYPDWEGPPIWTLDKYRHLDLSRSLER